MIEIIAAIICGAVAYFIVGWVVFELLLGKFMSGNMTTAPGFFKSDEESSLLWIFVSCLAYSFLFSILFTQWTNTTDVYEGILIGGFIGGAISVMTSTYWYGSSHLFSNFKPVIADFFAAICTVGVMGGVVAFVLTLV